MRGKNQGFAYNIQYYEQIKSNQTGLNLFNFLKKPFQKLQFEEWMWVTIYIFGQTIYSKEEYCHINLSIDWYEPLLEPPIIYLSI